MIQFAVPYYRRLSTHHGWDKASKYDYSVVRFHFATVPDGRGRGLVIGPPVAEITVPNGATQDRSVAHTLELEIADERRAAQEWVRESRELSELASHVGTSAAVRGFTLDAGLAATWRQEFTERVKIEAGRTTTTTTKCSESISVKIHVDGAITAGARMYVASNYRECIETLYLAYVDVLAVRYEKRHLLAGRKRVKIPAFQDSWNALPLERRPNVSPPLNWPICNIRYWQFVPDSHPVFLADEYPTADIDPNQIETLAPSGTAPRSLPYTKPSLYNISTSAFPLRWSTFKRVARERGDDIETDDDSEAQS